ncbi:MAG: serine protease Do [Abditibacteriota bacterium]|nr:serine protease Do [Abditibacteriota bacterium]
MKPKIPIRPFQSTLIGAVGIGFFVGACVKQFPQGASLTGATQPDAAQAQPIRNAGDLQRLSTTFATIAKQVTPAVVNIQSQQIIRGRILRDPFEDFFGGDGGAMFREPDRRSQSLGSGVLVDTQGIIITNNHVVKNASTITVTLSDRRRFPARLVGTDPDTDVAVLKIQGANLPALKWADSTALQVGEIVLAIGSPFNLSSTVTQGILSAKGRRDLGISAYEDFLQTDAAINPGNSGGALVDVNGNLIGINTAILSESGGNQGIGLAIPANLARRISGQLVASGQVTRGWLGMVVEPITEDIATALGLPQTQGVAVTGIYTNGPAGRLPWSQDGNDVILKVNNTAIESPGQLRNLAAEMKPGATAQVQVWQDGKTQTFTIKVGKRSERVQGV